VGLGLIEKIDGRQFGTEFDIDDLIWMDTATRVESASKSIGGGGMSMNEARKKYHGIGPTPGGETPYLQEQNWPVSQLATRELPTRQPSTAAALPEPADDAEDDDELDMAASFASSMRVKSLEHGLYGA
jgi:hypothetical protein